MSARNLLWLRCALARSGARIYKLTPALTLTHARTGHDFHFTVPQEQGADAYLDVMARPPRVGGFREARSRSEEMETDWGSLPVVSVRDLVLLKLTRRFADYDVISNLVSVRLLREPPSRRILSWALETSFRIEDLQRLIEGSDLVRGIAAASSRAVLRALVRGDDLLRAGAALADEIVRRQAADVAYWRPIIDELRALRAAGSLLEVGAPVV